MNVRALVLLLIVAPLAACQPNRGDDDAAANGRTRPPTEVAVITVQAGVANISHEYPGRLRAWRRAEIRARVEGIVEKRLFDEGDMVKAGAALFQIEDQTYRAALQSAQAEVEASRLAVERNRGLLEKKLVSPEAVDEARARYQQAQAQLAQARRDLENTRVPAPIDGRIGRTEVTEGALVGRDQATLLATIEQLDPIYVDFTRSEAERIQLSADMRSGKFRPADSDRVGLVLANGQPYPPAGQLLFSEQKVDPASGTVLVRARFPNADRLLLPGMFVRVRMSVAQAMNVVHIPQRAVQAGEKGLRVLVVSPDGKVLSRDIETIGMDGPDFIVSKGLQTGEKVIVEGLQKVRPGAIVKAVPWTTSPANDVAAPAER